MSKLLNEKVNPNIHNSPSQKIVHIISGTHWDREWRFTAEQSKFRLAELIDNVLETLEKNPDYKYFHLDGGTVMIEDYLSVRPQNCKRLKKLIDQGRIPITNWYTLPETNIVSPEAVIRNILIGREIARQFNATSDAGYTATGYGQPSQLPQIFKNFGFKSAIFYRGTNKHQVPPLSRWQGADGSEVFLIRGFDEVTRANWRFFGYMPLILGKSADMVKSLNSEYKITNLPVHMADVELYEMPFKTLYGQASIPKNSDTLMQRYEIFKQQAYPYAIGRHIIGFDMGDNGCPWIDQPKLIEALNKILPDSNMVQSTIEQCANDVIDEIDHNELSVVKGELRHTAIEYGWNGLFGFTQSSRVKMKLLNERAETNLILLAEPLASFASCLGFEYPQINLEQAWKELLKNHAHDSICGSSIDVVHEDMTYRFRQISAISNEIAKRSIENIWKQIDHSCFQQDDQVITLFNTLPYNRSLVQNLVLDLPREIFADDTFRKLPTGSPIPDLFDIIDENNNLINYEIIDFQDITIDCENEMESAGSRLKMKRHKILLPVNIPSMGYKTYAVRKRRPKYCLNSNPEYQRNHIAQPGGILENEFLKITINPNGTFNLLDKKHSRLFNNLHYFDDRISIGDAHLEPQIIKDTCTTSLGLNSLISLVESNTLRGVYRIDIKLPVPKQLNLDRYRSNVLAEIPITIVLTLTKDAKRLEISTTLQNNIRDHRLLVMFPTLMQTNTIAVETPFAVENRSFLWKQTLDNAEGYYVYQPMQNFVDVSDKTSGLAIINKGLREYAAWDDPNRTISLTLLRTQRAYMTANGNMTPTELEKYPGSHSIGTFTFNYALYPHSNDWLKGNVLFEAYDYKTPVHAIQGPVKESKLPPAQSLFTFEPNSSIMLSALYKSAIDNSTILRIWNITNEELEVKITTKLKFNRAQKITMAEEKQGKTLTMMNDQIILSLKGTEIATIRFD